MAVNQIKIEVNSLKEGMFVSNLDRPWHETPFPLQGFYVKDDDDVKALANYCKFVFVDMQKRKTSMAYEAHAKFNPEKDSKATFKKKPTGKEHKVAEIKIKAPQVYETTHSFKKETNKAVRLHKQVYHAIDNIFATVESGGEIQIQETESVANGMVESVIRNPDALVWLAKMEEDAHGYQHSVKASIWALVFGRSLGLDKKMLKHLAMGVLLSHVGKTRLPQDLIDKEATLSSDEQAQFQNYVQHSVDILSQMENIPKAVISIAQHHQERNNGSGFPNALMGDKIPLLAKIAGLVDHYQSLITPRDNSLGMSPMDAVAELYEERDISFQSDLVERFIQAIGVYPTGTLVELNSREIGIVTGHHEDRRLMPTVMIVTDKNKHPLKRTKIVDLKDWNHNRKDNDLLLIKDSLPKGAYDIDESFFLDNNSSTRWGWNKISSMLAS